MDELPKKAETSEDRNSQEAATTGPPVVDVYERLRQLRGRIRFSRTWEELKEDRS
jgi:hypothetical protein